MQLSVTVITRNEAAVLPALLDSVKWADEIVVVDCGSSDDTTEIASKQGARVIHHEFQDFASQKNFAHSQARNDWVLSLDADEVCPRALAEEVQALPESSDVSGYFVARRNYFQNRWIRRCGWYPDYKLRLYRRSQGTWQGKVHETVRLQEGLVTSRLRNPMDHYTYKGLERYLNSIQQYALLAAQQMKEEGRTAGALDLLFRPPAAFLKKYVLQGGFLEGRPGFVISSLTAYGVFCRYSLLAEMTGAVGR